MKDSCLPLSAHVNSDHQQIAAWIPQYFPLVSKEKLHCPRISKIHYLEENMPKQYYQLLFWFNYRTRTIWSIWPPLNFSPILNMSTKTKTKLHWKAFRFLKGIWWWGRGLEKQNHLQTSKGSLKHPKRSSGSPCSNPLHSSVWYNQAVVLCCYCFSLLFLL